MKSIEPKKIDAKDKKGVPVKGEISKETEEDDDQERIIRKRIWTDNFVFFGVPIIRLA